MRRAPILALVVLFGLANSAWAQFGGGGGGFGNYQPGPEGFEVETIDGITAYREASDDEASGVEVTWSGAGSQASQKLDEKIRGEETKIQFVDTPLSDVVHYLKQQHDISIVLDKADLERSNFDTDIAITCHYEGLTLPAALDLLTQQLNLGWHIDRGTLIIASMGNAHLQRSVRIYKLHQLDAVGAAQVISKIVSPSEWHDRGGSANMAVIRDRNLLVIRHNREGHEAVTSLLTHLEEMK